MAGKRGTKRARGKGGGKNPHKRKRKAGTKHDSSDSSGSDSSGSDSDSSSSDARPACRFGASCYRINPSHLAQFRHPPGHIPGGAAMKKHSNTGGTPPPPVGPLVVAAPAPAAAAPAAAPAPAAPAAANTGSLPPCKYGVNCYRKNLLHFAQFWHPTQGAAATGGGGGGAGGGAGASADSNGSGKGKGKAKAKAASQDSQDGVLSDAPTAEYSGSDSDGWGDDSADDDGDGDGADGGGGGGGSSSSGPQLKRSYSSMTEAERRQLIEDAIKEKKRLEEELAKARAAVSKKNAELEDVRKQLDNDLYVPGEREAMEKGRIEYFELFPERSYDPGSAAEIHLRLAESQFYRLLMPGSQHKVTKVEYVVSPKLVKAFKKHRKALTKKYGADMARPVLAFHGTADKNIQPICETGFLVPGTSGFKHATDTGWYGRGVYFSEWPSYSMGYIHGQNRLLMCQVLPGKAYRCTKLIHGASLKAGYDSHTSPDDKELVIFNSAAILPAYIVYFKQSNADFKYTKPAVSDLVLAKAKKTAASACAAAFAWTAPSKTLKGMQFAVFGSLQRKQAEVKALIKSHGGKVTTTTAKAAKTCTAWLRAPVELAAGGNATAEQTADSEGCPVVSEVLLYHLITGDVSGSKVADALAVVRKKGKSNKKHAKLLQPYLIPYDKDA